MKNYIFTGYKSKQDYLPIIQKLGRVEVICSDFEMIKKLPKISPHSFVFGFSLGAFIAYKISQKIPIKKMVLVSVSPLGQLGKTKAKECYIFCGNKEGNAMRRLNKKLGGVEVVGQHALKGKILKEVLMRI
jgi:hypothetical protein